MKKILIVGGTGFIGYHLIKYLKKKILIYLVYLPKNPKKKEE